LGRTTHARAPSARPSATDGVGRARILELAERDRLTRLFAAVSQILLIDEVPFTWVFAGVDDYWESRNEAAGAIAMVLQRLPNYERERIRPELAQRLGPSGTQQIELTALSLVVSAS